MPASLLSTHRLLRAAILVTVGLFPIAATHAETGKLELTVVDGEGGRPVPCRMQLKSAAGRPMRPKKAPFWNDHFAFPGRITLQLPLGNYGFEIERGPEYPVLYGHFELHRSADDAKTVSLHRHIDMAANGWYSGDLAVRRPIAEMDLLMQAEDLHVAEVLTWWNGKSDPVAKPAIAGQPVPVGTDRFYQVQAGGQARAGGTLLYFHLPQPLPMPAGDREIPALPEVIRQARGAPAAWVDVARAYSWDLPLLVALGQVDSIQLANDQLCRDRVAGDDGDGRPRDQRHYGGTPLGIPQWSIDIYYHLLNCGLRIPPSAGSGSGMSSNPVGYNRMYVHVDGPLAYDKWWQAFRAGAVMITNGPLLAPCVEGAPPGHVFQFDAGAKPEFEIGLTFSTREPVSYLEIVQDGQVAHSIRFEDYSKGGHLPKVKFQSSGWFLIRAVTDQTKTYRFAMTAPYYVQVGYQPRISKTSAQFFLDWVYQRARQIHVDDPAQRRQVLEYHRQARDFWQVMYNKANAP